MNREQALHSPKREDPYLFIFLNYIQQSLVSLCYCSGQKQCFASIAIFFLETSSGISRNFL